VRINIAKYQLVMFLFSTLVLFAHSAAAVDEVPLLIKNHRFEPAEVRIPANTKVKLRIHNQDATPEEFESYELNREKVIMGNSKATVFVGPLKPGKYPFFGEFNPDTAQGVLVVSE